MRDASAQAARVIRIHPHGIECQTGQSRVPSGTVPHEALPPDPFAGDPDDPTRELRAGDEDEQPITEAEREELVEDLADLAVYQALLESRGVRGIVVDCADCDEPHYHDWALLRASLEQLLNDGRMRPHEPAFDPNPRDYVTWEYCRGFADGVTATESAR
jgi:hypothetical protein